MKKKHSSIRGVKPKELLAMAHGSFTLETYYDQSFKSAMLHHVTNCGLFSLLATEQQQPLFPYVLACEVMTLSLDVFSRIFLIEMSSLASGKNQKAIAVNTFYSDIMRVVSFVALLALFPRLPSLSLSGALLGLKIVQIVLTAKFIGPKNTVYTCPKK